jgi:NADH dehydrogenase
VNVSLIGGTGFVGSHLVERLIAEGHLPRLLVRPRSEAKPAWPGACETVTGDVADRGAVADCLAGSDAAIYLIGILRENPPQGVTFDELQFHGVERTIGAARAAGVRRFLLMSANGVRPDGTPYQRTKFRAEAALKASDLDWTVFRPSVIFGDPRGHMEFCTQLKRDIIDSPLPAPLFYAGLLPLNAGGFQLAPVAVADVAAAFCHALTHAETIGQTYTLCGPRAYAWRDILRTIAAACGRTKVMLPAPALAVQAAAAIFDRFPWFPITRDQIAMLLEGNSCEAGNGFEHLGLVPTAFDASALAYLNA